MKCADCKVNYDLPISGCMYCKCRLCGNCYFAHLASEKKKKEDEPYNINLKTGIATPAPFHVLLGKRTKPSCRMVSFFFSGSANTILLSPSSK